MRLMNSELEAPLLPRVRPFGSTRDQMLNMTGEN